MRNEYRQFCAIARTLDVVGQRWTLLVVRELLLRGPLSAAGIARGLPEVPMNQLVERLALLEARGLVSPARGRVPARVYELTDAGRELGDVLEALGRFGLARLAGAGREPGDAVLPHVLTRQLELRYELATAGEGLNGRFELVLDDPQELWSVEPGRDAPATFAVIARPEGMTIRCGACLDPDATLRCTVDACARLIAGDPEAGVEVEVTGDRALAEELLAALTAAAPDAAAVAA
jgi:DNA-binding HxlR family transcriptional regulator